MIDKLYEHKEEANSYLLLATFVVCGYVLGGIIYWIPYVSPEVKVMDFWPRPQLPFAKENPKEYFQNFIKLEKDIKPIYLKMGVNSL